MSGLSNMLKHEIGIKISKLINLNVCDISDAVILVIEVLSCQCRVQALFVSTVRKSKVWRNKIIVGSADFIRDNNHSGLLCCNLYI